ncbi:MAG: FHA domain-containing protein [Bacteroidaceae bacterium]|nr:FHA domain-containing protein [Bacteroidaceae bacterium]
MLTKLDSIVEKKHVDCEVNNLEYSDDYKYMNVTVKYNSATATVELSDTAAVSVRVSQKAGLTRGVMIDDKRPPILTKIENIAKEEMLSYHVKILMLIDLSLPQNVVDSELDAVRQARALLGPELLYVAFMQGDQVSETYQATDYILDNYFKSDAKPYIYLYRSVLEKLKEVTDSTSVFADAEHKGVIILSAGDTYDGDRPLDPRHFNVQQGLAELAPLLVENNVTISFTKYSNNGGSNANNVHSFESEESYGSQQELGVLRLLCNQTNGLFQSSFNWKALRDDFMHDHQIDYDDYKFYFVMPDNKVFRGNRMSLNLDFINKDTDEIISTCRVEYSFGSVFYPIIIGGKDINKVFAEGLLVAFLLCLAIWLALQIVVPWIRYQIFLHKHVIRYQGPQMSKDGVLVSELCYLCKAPFQIGDEVVTKCSHTMHKECWDDNGYQCPEHSRNCKHGSHYYNSHNLLDVRNATFYMQWILAGILAGLFAWLFFMARVHFFNNEFLTSILFFVNDIEPGTPEANRFLIDNSVHLDYQPSFGFSVAFFVTLFLSILSLRNVRWQNRAVNVLVRACVAGALGYFIFLINCIVAVMLGIKTNLILLDWIPWILMTGVIMCCVTWHTRVRIRSIWLAAACLLGIVSMYMWMLIYHDTLVDFRLYLLISFLFTTTVLAICIAFETPMSEHYFLQTSGAIKQMDIALYKWLRADPSSVVTLGQSVDCSIHLSWDISGNVAPVHAEIYLRNGTVRLKALEKGVLYNGRPLLQGHSEPLSHGNYFSIGNTTFRYLEKDF